MLNSRFSGIVKNVNEHDYHIIGCGAIGSTTAMELAHLGAETFQLYDNDSIEDANVGVGAYRMIDKGFPKVESLQNLLEEVNPNIKVSGYYTQVTPETIRELPVSNKSIVVLAVDSMRSRLEIVRGLINQVHALIDGRMGAEVFQMYIITRKNTLDDYLNTWYPDEKASSEPCHSKATPYCSHLAGAMIANAIVRVITGKPAPNVVFSFAEMAMMIG